MDRWTYDEFVNMNIRMRKQDERIAQLEAIVLREAEPVAKQLARAKIPIRGKPRMEAGPVEPKEEPTENDPPEEGDDEADWLDEEEESDDKQK